MRIEFNNDNVKSASNHVNFLIKDNNEEFNLFVKSNDHNLKLSGESFCAFDNNFSINKFLPLKIYKKHHLYFIQDNINAILGGKKNIYNLIILYIVLIKSNLEINRKKISKFMRGIK